MSTHRHKPNPQKSGQIYLVCNCGAIKLAKKPADDWHTCPLCTIGTDHAKAKGR